MVTRIRPVRTSLTLAVATVALALPAGGAHAEDLAPPHQALLLLRILAYDRALGARAGDRVTVAVVYRDADKRARTLADEMATSLSSIAQKATVAKLPVRVALIPHDAGTFEQKLGELRPAAVYVAGGLEGALEAITRATRRFRALSFASDARVVERGVSVGLLAHDARARLVINLASARAEGADLDAALLRLAEVNR